MAHPPLAAWLNHYQQRDDALLTAAPVILRRLDEARSILAQIPPTISSTLIKLDILDAIAVTQAIRQAHAHIDLVYELGLRQACPGCDISVAVVSAAAAAAHYLAREALAGAMAAIDAVREEAR